MVTLRPLSNTSSTTHKTVVIHELSGLLPLLSLRIQIISILIVLVSSVRITTRRIRIHITQTTISNRNTSMNKQLSQVVVYSSKTSSINFSNFVSSILNPKPETLLLGSYPNPKSSTHLALSFCNLCCPCFLCSPGI